jgi:hypothetical protein
VISGTVHETYLEFRRSHKFHAEKCFELTKVKGPVMNDEINTAMKQTILGNTRGRENYLTTGDLLPISSS